MAFDRYLSARAEKRGKAKVFMYAASTVAHGAAFAGLLFWTFWQVEKVQGKPAAVVFVPTLAPPPPPETPKTPDAPRDPEHRSGKRPPHPVQLTTSVPPEPEPPVTSGGGEDTRGSGDDHGTPGGTGVPGGTGPVTDEPPPIVATPQVVLESVIGAARIAGVREIALPLDVKQALVAQGRRTTRAAVKLCLDTDGVPNRIEVVQSTGFSSADAAIRLEMAAWRYRPYRVNGAPVPVCTAVMFQYTISD